MLNVLCDIFCLILVLSMGARYIFKWRNLTDTKVARIFLIVENVSLGLAALSWLLILFRVFD